MPITQWKIIQSETVTCLMIPTVWYSEKGKTMETVRKPWWLRQQESTCNAGDSFNPWVRKIPWRRKWQLTPVFLPEEFHGQRSLAGYSPWGRRVRHNWATNTLLHGDSKKFIDCQEQGEREGWICGTWRIFKAVELFCRILRWWLHVKHLSKSMECKTLSVNPNVDCEFWMMIVSM